MKVCLASGCDAAVYWFFCKPHWHCLKTLALTDRSFQRSRFLRGSESARNLAKLQCILALARFEHRPDEEIQELEERLRESIAAQDCL